MVTTPGKNFSNFGVTFGSPAYSSRPQKIKYAYVHNIIKRPTAARNQILDDNPA
jgi:hypothetical protein